MDSISRSLGNHIKIAREKAGLTQDDLSDKAGLAYSTLAKIEQGAIKNPSVFTVYEIAKALDVGLETLISGYQPDTISPAIASKTRFIYCDVNGVMLRFYNHAFVSLAEETGAPFDKIETTFWHYNDPANRGEMTEKQFNLAMARQLGVSNIDWRHHYMGAVQPVNEMHDLLKRLHKKFKIGLLTNIMPGFLDEMFAGGLVPDLKYDAVVDSSIVGSVKPEEKIYREAEKQAGYSGMEILLIDDSRANLTAADELGWRVFWFDDYDPKESIKRIEQILEV
jgi:HAD superfamily hydrolase (TIGR01509 family)